MLHPLENIPKTSMENVLTIDIEDWFHILDIGSMPSIQDWHKLESTVTKNTQVILDLLNKYHTKGTFFVLGWVAEHFPDLVPLKNQSILYVNDFLDFNQNRNYIYRQKDAVIKYSPQYLGLLLKKYS